MFKSIQWKIIAVFLMLTVSVMIVVGTFLLQNISAYYHNTFSQTMQEKVFTSEFKKTLDDASKNGGEKKVYDLLALYSVQMGIDSYRNFFVLDKNAKVLSTSSSSVASVEVSENVLLALSGEVGKNIDRDSKYMDFALPIEGGYIVYIRDSKTELFEITKNIFINILWSLLFGLLLSAFIGFFLARTIIAPISTLQYRAEAMRGGDFGGRTEVRSRDEIGRMTVAFNDMALRIKKGYEEISAEKNKIETILYHMSDGLSAFDSNGELLHINPAAEVLLSGFDKKDFNTLFLSLGVDITIEQIIYLEHEKAVERNIEINGKTVKACFAPFNMEHERAAGVVVVFQDITEHLRLDNARKEFVADVSHELRTPIATIKSYAETVIDIERDNPESQSTVQFVKVIENQADRMTRLVKDLLTLSQLDSTSRAIKKERFDVSQMCDSVVSAFSLEAKSRRHALTFKKETDMPLYMGDPDKIEQVLVNLVSNALKYTPDGGRVDVSCGLHKNDVFIRVADNGIGIPKEDLPRIFDRFYRVDKARSRESGGTGLGLAIAKEIVELHGGKIYIDSEKRKGTKVTISLPL